MRTVGCLSVLAILPLTLASEAQAQAPVPPPTGFAPPPPAVTAPAPNAAPAAATPGYAQPPGSAAPAAPGAAPPTTAPGVAPPAGAAAPTPGVQPGTATGPGGEATFGTQAGTASGNPFVADASVDATGAAGKAEPADAGSPLEEEAWYREHREDSLSFGNSVSGSVGLLHLQTPFSGAPGTFRASFLTGYFSGSGFLCPNRDACGITTGDATQDEAESISSDIAISATVLPYLEGYIGMHSVASSNSFGRPKLLQVVGDTNFGLKLFTPAKPDRIFAAGTSLDLWLLNGSGSLGISNADFTMRAMASLDLTRRSSANERIPLRFHSSLGYLFAGSGSLIADIEEKERGGNRISRIERFGLDINRVDSFLLGIGAEYVHKVVQPFVEWTFDIPVNFRLDYLCTASTNGRAPGDGCLRDQAGFASTPSRLSIGTRITPGIRGLQGLVAFDVGTGATSTFIEEVAPEMPWRFFVGIGFAHDITSKGYDPSAAPQVVEKVVQLPPPPEYRVVGLVLDEKSQQPIPDAIIKFQGQSLTGMVARQDGSFETTNLQPGTYSFTVTADGYREGACTVNVAATGSPIPDAAPAAPAATDPYGAPQTIPGAAAPTTTPGVEAATAPTGPIVTNVACPLKAMPAVGAIQGALFDGDTNLPVPDARLTIRDAKGRELSLSADSAGAFRFENVPVGQVKISVDADGYMPAMVEVDVKAKTEQRPPITLNRRPKKPNVNVAGKEIKLAKQIDFANDSAVISQDSMGLVQEIALTLKERPTLARVEIQGHTDNSGTPAYNKRLSQERAEAVRNALIGLGIESTRLTAIGYGQDRALVPNSSEANKQRNRRIQLMIQDKH